MCYTLDTLQVVHVHFSHHENTLPVPHPPPTNPASRPPPLGPVGLALPFSYSHLLFNPTLARGFPITFVGVPPASNSLNPSGDERGL